jgi:hypothetical protein
MATPVVSAFKKKKKNTKSSLGTLVLTDIFNNSWIQVAVSKVKRPLRSCFRLRFRLMKYEGGLVDSRVFIIVPGTVPYLR